MQHQWISNSVICLILSIVPAVGADFTCVDSRAMGSVVHNETYTPEWRGLKEVFRWGGVVKSNCDNVAIRGPIIPGDADKLEWLLAPQYGREGVPYRFFLLSEGGSLSEAITMGRLFRATASSVAASLAGKSMCGGSGQPPCCSSACAIAYFGAAEWTKGDRLGLHRPTLRDLADQDYSEAQKQLEAASLEVREYLREMEVPNEVYEKMMGVGPDELNLHTLNLHYPATIRDWLIAKCAQVTWIDPPTDEDRKSCVDSEFLWSKRFYGYGQHLNFGWFKKDLSKNLEKQLYENERIGPIRKAAIRLELDAREKNRP